MTAFVADQFFFADGTSVGGSFDATGANYIRIYVFATNGVAVTSVSYGAQTPTLISGSVNDGIVGVYHLLSPTSGSQTLTVNFDGSSPRLCAWIVARSGVHASTPAGTPSFNTAEDEAASVVVTSATGQLVEGFICMASGADGVASAGTGQTERENQTNWNDSFISSSGVEKAGASSVQLDWTSPSVDNPAYFAIGIPVIPAAASGYTITADQGSYALTGQNANLVRARTVTAQQGSYALTGQNAGLIFARRLTAQQGSYTLIGQDAYVDIEMNADFGTYSLTGQDAALNRAGVGTVLTADQGSYVLTGFAAFRRLTMAAAAGSYALTGQTANLIYARKLVADFGSYQLSGRNVILLDNGVPDAGGTQRYLMQRRFFGFRLSR